jgi:hypothetical protein
VTSPLDPLIRDLVEWVAREPRTYAQVMDAWRTSCPRLTVWEDAVDRGFLVRQPGHGQAVLVSVTEAGRRFVSADRRAAGAGLQLEARVS